MWLVTTTGFYSIVKKPGDADLCIRSRVRRDLVDLKKRHLPSLGKIIETDNSDYRFRAYASEKAVEMAVSSLAADIDYANFKDEVKHVQGAKRASVYMRVWTALLELQPLHRRGKESFMSAGSDMIDRRWRTALGDID